ncbi:MAG TPA: ScyD/ScyE family protein [Ilumatobacter sp.]|nr:ScyD/ScyE family protein [Ilumatobacter sp.]
MVLPSTANAKPAAPDISPLATFGGLGSGSTIGPGGALYVTDGNAGSIDRIDPKTGAVSTYADGLPTQILGIGGAMDVAFVGSTAYVLVTLVGGDIVGVGSFGDDIVGIYRLENDGSFTVIADLGAWAEANPPDSDIRYFITTGVHYSLETFRNGFLVTDGHHNRVLHVTRDGHISDMVSFGNIVPTGLETSGATVYVAQTGPVPHPPEVGKVVSFTAQSSTATDVAAGASMIVDVEMGRGHQLYALSQGDWDEAGGEGGPAFPNTGRLMRVEDDGTMTAVVDGQGNEIVLDRPTSLEFRGTTAYVVSLTGTVYTIKNI